MAGGGGGGDGAGGEEGEGEFWAGEGGWRRRNGVEEGRADGGPPLFIGGRSYVLLTFS